MNKQKCFGRQLVHITAECRQQALYHNLASATAACFIGPSVFCVYSSFKFTLQIVLLNYIIDSSFKLLFLDNEKRHLSSPERRNQAILLQLSTPYDWMDFNLQNKCNLQLNIKK